MEERAVPGQVDRNAFRVPPRRFGGGKESEPFPGAPLHFHHMDKDVNCAWMPRIERERAARRLFGTAILTVFLETERIHRKDARVAGDRGIPFGYDAGKTIAQHPPLAEAKVQRIRGRERENVARPVIEDGAVTFGSETLLAVEPGARRGCVTACGIVLVEAG